MGRFSDILIRFGESQSKKEIERLNRIRPDLFVTAAEESRELAFARRVKAVNYIRLKRRFKVHNAQSA